MTELRPGITVVIPTIAPRAELLRRALFSVAAQTYPPDVVLIGTDRNHEGPAATRNQALARVDTEWVAFLDDDDELLPHHLETLWACAVVTGADLVYPWFDVVSSRHTPGFDPLGRFGLPFDPDLLDSANYIPVTVLARTAVIVAAGGFVNRGEDGSATCEDWGCWLAMRDAGAKFVHLPERTWVWHWHDGNTSGRTDVW